ncbi:MAG: HPr family phosphocarrier protein [Propionibacteriaceae bacterium]|jgi:phosphocarrier protein|nr:HPr family phosphocarrier protein [Propionibacteriaceae bacterium]
MATRTVTIAAKVGLHARPAALFVQAVNAIGHPVSIAKAGGTPVDARSILAVMALGAQQGDEVVLTAEGENAEAGLDRLADMLAELDQE